MPCVFGSTPGGGTFVACTRGGERCRCGRAAVKRCDAAVTTRASGTCDIALCAVCARPDGPGRDLCPAHARAGVASRDAITRGTALPPRLLRRDRRGCRRVRTADLAAGWRRSRRTDDDGGEW